MVSECYHYDAEGNLTEHIRSEAYARHGAKAKGTHYIYDEVGRLSHHCDRTGSEIHLYYNMYHAPVRREHKASGLQDIYGYRKDGKLSYAIGGGMRYDYSYYPDGKLKEKKPAEKSCYT